MIKVNRSAAATVCALALSVSTLVADTWNKKTIITINEAIQVPGKVLQPGKYVMKLMDSPSNRHVVQIFNEREDQLQTTILAIPNYRLQPTGKTEFQWWETPAGQPKAIRAWFYPGDNFGQEFAYPKNMSVEIAKYSNEVVPTTYAQTEAELTTAKVGTVDRAGTELELDRQTYSRADGAQPNTPAPPVAETQVAQVTPQATEQPLERATITPARTPAAETLPATGSPLPLVGLAGFVALGASVAIRALGRS